MNQTNPGTNPAVVELRALRSEITQLKDEVAGFRLDVKKQKLVQQIASGILLSGFAFWVLASVLGVFAQIFGSR